MRILLRDKNKIVIVPTKTVSVSNQAPYSVKFKSGFKVYELFTLCTNYNHVLQYFVNDVIDLRDWYCAYDKCSSDNSDAIKLFYDVSTIDTDKLPEEILQYKRLVKCLNGKHNVFNYFPSKLLEDLVIKYCDNF